MSYQVSEHTRAQWRRLAEASGLPYATIVGQHVYDIQGLVSTLTAQHERATQAASDPALDAAGRTAAVAQLASLTTQLTRAQEQLAAYQQEAALPAPEHT